MSTGQKKDKGLEVEGKEEMIYYSGHYYFYLMMRILRPA